jgi:hypothetical protein
VAGYAVLTNDPAIVVPEEAAPAAVADGVPERAYRPSSDDVRQAFG